MATDELNIKDIINKTKNFDQPYAPAIPEGIHEVEAVGFEEKDSAKGYKMILITVQDLEGRQSRVNQMLEIQWIEGTIRLIKGLYTHNTPEAEQEAAKEKINDYFDKAKDAADLQHRCTEILTKLIDKGCFGWLRVERQFEDDAYPDKQLTAYKPSYRWHTNVEEDEAKTVTTGTINDNGEIVEDEDDDIFKKA